MPEPPAAPNSASSDTPDCPECRRALEEWPNRLGRDLNARDLADLLLVHGRLHVVIVDGKEWPRPLPARKPPLPQGSFYAFGSGVYDAFLADREFEAKKRRRRDWTRGTAAGARGLAAAALRIDHAPQDGGP